MSDFFQRQFLSFDARLLQALKISGIAGFLLTAGILLLSAGMWFEFEQTVVLVWREVAPKLLTMESLKGELITALSSRDTNALSTLYWLWQLVHQAVVIIAVITIIRRIQEVMLSVLVFALVTLFITSFFQLPSVIDGDYLGCLIALFIVNTAVVWWFCRLHQEAKLAPSNQTLIAYASQSGSGKSIALDMAKSAGVTCDVRAFNELTPQSLTQYRRLLIVASTYGDGEAPEKSLSFSQALAQSSYSLSHLSFAVLALGDKAYPQFCAFGHYVANLLAEKQGNELLPVREVNRVDEDVISQWWQQVGSLFGWQTTNISKAWHTGLVVDNQCLNSQQVQRPAHTMTIEVSKAQYQAGDLLEVLTPLSITVIDERLLEFGLAPQTIVRLNGQTCQLNYALTQLEWTNQVANSAQELVDKLANLAPRVYSIASAPNDNKVRLLVRHLRKDDGSDGFSSSQLCDATLGTSFKVAIRQHESFRLPERDVPIIMIAAGTGIAPFMSFLAQRQLDMASGSWLIFGEQYSSHDNYFNEELDKYLEKGTLSRIDYAFSRDSQWQSFGRPKYVNDVLLQQSKLLFHWLYDKEAQLYVCGNKAGMGESVQAILKQLLKDDYQRLITEQRLHFDLY